MKHQETAPQGTATARTEKFHNELLVERKGGGMKNDCDERTKKFPCRDGKVAAAAAAAAGVVTPLSLTQKRSDFGLHELVGTLALLLHERLVPGPAFRFCLKERRQ